MISEVENNYGCLYLSKIKLFCSNYYASSISLEVDFTSSTRYFFKLLKSYYIEQEDPFQANPNSLRRALSSPKLM
jgi:hypothetical protein